MIRINLLNPAESRRLARSASIARHEQAIKEWGVEQGAAAWGFIAEAYHDVAIEYQKMMLGISRKGVYQ